jgi:cytochrome b561
MTQQPKENEMKTKTAKIANLLFTALCMALMYMGFIMMDEFGIGYLWLGMYTCGAYGLGYQVFDYFVSEATN